MVWWYWIYLKMVSHNAKSTRKWLQVCCNKELLRLTLSEKKKVFLYLIKVGINWLLPNCRQLSNTQMRIKYLFAISICDISTGAYMISIKKYILLNITYCRMRKISMLNTTHVWHHWNNKIQNLHDVFNFFIAGDFLKYWLAVVIDKSVLIV